MLQKTLHHARTKLSGLLVREGEIGEERRTGCSDVMVEEGRDVSTTARAVMLFRHVLVLRVLSA